MSNSNLLSSQRLYIKEGEHYEIDSESLLPYEHVAILGHGGSAVVEKVRDSVTQLVYARKVFRVLSRRLDLVSELYQREVQIIRRLAPHHHVIRVFATYRIKRELAVILEPVADGGDLASYLSSFRDLGTTDPLRLERQDVLLRAFGCLAVGLSHLHECNIRHKDIKPHNILIHEDSIIYTDFGVARDYNGDNSTTDGHPGSFTMRYCSPEVADHDTRNRKSDVFSLGCVFLEILASLHPGERLDELLDGGPYYEMVDEIQAVLENCSAPIIPRVIRDMLYKHPGKRPSANDLADTLREAGNKHFCDQCKRHPQQKVCK